eukprot:Polyplicarium_translucidae@DN2132_c0_g1_i3.p1
MLHIHVQRTECGRYRTVSQYRAAFRSQWSYRIHVRSPRVLRCRTSRPTIRTARIGDPRAVHCIGICDPPFDEPEDQALEKAVASPLAAPVPKPQPRLVDAETSSSVFAVLQRRETHVLCVD